MYISHVFIIYTCTCIMQVYNDLYANFALGFFSIGMLRNSIVRTKFLLQFFQGKSFIEKPSKNSIGILPDLSNTPHLSVY